ncbi:MAG TPA: carboxypeptidase regulatory-like domain-containing protein [Candidatus Dormibacteraeota bacterium]|nr:carboxypeptidase regulatory-like domain-containing protein [Candidatus Dormibacteraeota bacterium]
MQRLLKISLGMVFLLAVVVGAGSAYGQGGATGAISGTVLDSSGGAVAAAEVQIINAATDSVTRKVVTGTDGTFVAALLPPGGYYVVVNKSGFAEAKASGIEVLVTETTKIAITMKPGAVSEKVEISAQITTVETSTATTGQSITTETVRELPLATQNYQQLLTLSTGAQSELNAAAQLGRGSVKLFVNGQREDNNNFLIEGISATDYNVAQATYVPLPNPDVIQEFKVQTSLYDASQGRNGGGNVNAILKSGSREYHGDLYEFFRNDVLNANDFFLNREGQTRPVVKQNIFGASVGGPLVKEKAGFFFVNYQGTRQRSGLSPGTFISTTIPSLPADRSDASISNTFFGNTTTAIDPVVSKLLNFKSNQFGGGSGGFLIPTSDPTSGAFAISRPGKYTDDQFTANWDREFRGGQDKVSARFFFSDADTFLPFGGGDLPESLGSTLASSVSSTSLNFPFATPVHTRFLNITETHLFSPVLVNEFRFGFVHINDELNNIPPVTTTDLGIDRPTNSVTNSIYKFVFASSGFEIGPAPFGNQSQDQNNLNFVDTVSWVRGAHVFRFGGEFTRVGLDKDFPQVFNGELFFTNTPDGNTDFQNFLLGTPQFSFGGGGVSNHAYRSNNFGFFAQDDWKFKPNLTLNLGFRTELLGAFHDDLCHIGNLDPRLANAGQFPFLYPSCVKKLNLAGLTGSSNGSTFDNNYSTGIGPRVGLAYDLFGHHTTTIRAGYGIYYVREDVGTADQLSFQTPFLPVAFGGGAPGCLGSYFSATPLAGCPNPNPNALPQAGTLDPTFVPCLNVFQGFPGNDTTQAAIYGTASGAACPGPLQTLGIFGLAVPRHFVVPNTQQWNLTVQRALGRQWVLEVGYVGTKGTHLRETRDALQSQNATLANPVVLGGLNITTNTFANAVARSRAQGINGYNGFQLFANDAYSHYHSLQTTLSRRWSAGYFQAAYTFSKSTDATSTGNTAFNSAFNDESTLDASRGLSDFDRTHRLALSYRYDLPWFKDEKGLKGALLSGWAISGITLLQSGSPFSVLDSGAGSAFLGLGSAPGVETASLASGATLSGGLSHGSIGTRIDGYLNPTAFTTAPLLYPAQCDPNQSDPTVFPNSNFCTTAFGNLGRNTYRGPGQQNWDFSLIKNFKLTERQSLRFTTDFFNMWNHANFGNPSTTDVESIGLANSPFGRITSTLGTPRLIQFSLRYAF